jgi:hypothetical protein
MYVVTTHNRPFTSRLARIAGAPVLVAGLTLLVAAGCGSGGSGPNGAPTLATSASPGSATETIDERASGTTVQVRMGTSVVLVLHSTYWGAPVVSDQAVLTATAALTVSPSPGCVSGAGCGTVTERYRAAAVGTATITATRTSCGEALRCTGGNDRFRVTVKVTN